MTFACTVRHGNRLSCWNTMARSGPGPATSRPSTRMRPAVTRIRPSTALSSVVLPQPLGPTMQTSSPFVHVEVDAAQHGKDLLRPFIGEIERNAPHFQFRSQRRCHDTGYIWPRSFVKKPSRSKASSVEVSTNCSGFIAAALGLVLAISSSTSRRPLSEGRRSSG